MTKLLPADSFGKTVLREFEVMTWFCGWRGYQQTSCCPSPMRYTQDCPSRYEIPFSHIFESCGIKVVGSLPKKGTYCKVKQYDSWKVAVARGNGVNQTSLVCVHGRGIDQSGETSRLNYRSNYLVIVLFGFCAFSVHGGSCTAKLPQISRVWQNRLSILRSLLPN